MGRVIAIFNQKGGVGKTTTAINLSAAVAARGYRVLAIDHDPQANLSSGVGVDKASLKYTIYDLLLGQCDMQQVVMQTAFNHLWVLPGSMDLAGAEIEMVAMADREFRLYKQLETVRDEYDYIFIDCPPSLGLLTINALTAADSVLIPIQCEFFALEGVSQLVNTYNRMKEGLNRELALEGVLISMFDGRNNLSIQVVEEIKKYFNDSVYQTIIPRNVRLAEAPSYGTPIIYYDIKSRGGEAYVELADEFIERRSRNG